MSGAGRPSPARVFELSRRGDLLEVTAADGELTLQGRGPRGGDCGSVAIGDEARFAALLDDLSRLRDGRTGLIHGPEVWGCIYGFEPFSDVPAYYLIYLRGPRGGAGRPLLVERAALGLLLRYLRALAPAGDGPSLGGESGA